jgi:hypothetical protein
MKVSQFPFCLLLLLLSLSAHAQFRVSGVIRDAETKKALPFASVSSGDQFETSDIDGKFTLETDGDFTISYIGYQPQKITWKNGRSYYKVFLEPKTNKLHEVNVGENPALSIIRNTIRNKAQNDPQQKLSTFRFREYNKVVITANPDSVKGRIDSVYIHTIDGKKVFTKMDSSDYRFKKVISKQHLFESEKVSDYQFANDQLKETIIGTQMGGFRQPVYELMAVKLQSFSLYDKRYELLATKYNSPIDDHALSDYNFRLLDTVNIDGRKTFMVFFRTKKKRSAAGLQGVLYIDVENYAVAKAIIRNRGVIDVTATHDFRYVPEQKLWFPISEELRMSKGKNDSNIRILGETLEFETDTPSAAELATQNKEIRKRPKVASDFTYVLSKSWYFDEEFDVPVNIKHTVVRTEITDSAIHRSEAFWSRYRLDSLDYRSAYTYKALDSISQDNGLESKLRFGRKFLNGYVPAGPIDIGLKYLLSFNNYEGIRLGAGGITNDRLSRKYRVDGYTAYGTKDGQWKYSLGGAARLGKFTNSWIGISYASDIREIASTLFAIDVETFKIYDPRPINVGTFYHYDSWRGYLETRIIPKTESIWQVIYSHIDPRFDYFFMPNGQLHHNYDISAAQVAVQWNPFSDYMQTPTGRIETEKRFPKFTFQFTQALPKFMGSDFSFGKIDLRAEYEKNYLNGQKTSALFQAGYAYGDAPITQLYNTSPNNPTKDRLLERITLAGKNSFETMYFNEFFSSRYFMLQVKQASQRITISKKIRPSFVAVSRLAYGSMEKPEQHIGLDYKTLDKGFFESGLEVNQIFYGIGLSAFYRYGPNQLPTFEDNISVKVTFVLNLF